MRLKHLAEESGFSADQIREWERGQVVPRRPARVLAWHLAHAERERALEMSGLPVCEWVHQWEIRFEALPFASDASQQQLKELEDHTSTCPLCRRRAEYVDERFGPLPPYPEGRLARLLGPLLDAASVPNGWQGAVTIAGVVFILFGLARLMRHLPYSEPLGLVSYVLALAAGGTVLLSLYYGGLSPLHSRGAVARWLARCIAGIAGMVAFTGIFIISGYGSTLNKSGDPITWTQGVGLGTAMGVLYATFWPIAKHWRGWR
jgi:hypothetical protein